MSRERELLREAAQELRDSAIDFDDCAEYAPQWAREKWHFENATLRMRETARRIDALLAEPETGERVWRAVKYNPDGSLREYTPCTPDRIDAVNNALWWNRTYNEGVVVESARVGEWEAADAA